MSVSGDTADLLACPSEYSPKDMPLCPDTLATTGQILVIAVSSFILLLADRPPAPLRINPLHKLEPCHRRPLNDAHHIPVEL